MTKVQSKQVPGCSNYVMDSAGVITNSKTEKEVSIHTNSEGKWGSVRLYTDEGKQKTFQTEDIYKELFPKEAKKSGSANTAEKFVDERTERGRKITMPEYKPKPSKSEKAAAATKTDVELDANGKARVKEILAIDAPKHYRAHLLDKELNLTRRQIANLLFNDNAGAARNGLLIYSENPNRAKEIEAKLKEDAKKK